MKFHAVMLDECGQEFGAEIEAENYDEARELLSDDYPENRGILQIESPSDSSERIARNYAYAEEDDWEDHEDDWEDHEDED